MVGQDEERIFFALWPGAETRAALQQAAQSVAIERPARRVPVYNLHLTLHFIGNVSRETAQAMRSAAHAVEASAFELRMDRVGHFRPPRVAWLGPAATPPALADLHAALASALAPCGYRAERRRFTPHLTFARKIDAAPPATKFIPVEWRLEDFVLLRSRIVDNGVQYEVAETYPLT